MPAVITHRLRERFATLREIGVAVQHFPCHRDVTAESDRRNAHDILYCSYVVSGQAEHDIGDQRFSEGPGSLAVVHYGVGHRIRTGPDGIEVVNIYLDPERHALPTLPSELRGPLHRLLPLHPGLANRRNRLLSVTCPDPQPVAELLKRMWMEQEAARPGHLAMMEAQLRELLVHLGRALLANGVRGPADVDPPLEQACIWLSEHLSEEVGVDDLAAAVGLSRFHLCRRFRAYTGLSPMAYLMHQRLQEAALRLRATDDAILGIAIDCGFKDLGHFGRRFRALFGRPPGVYREG